jgi:alkanesulfonate monooxygenase SsuD/methylene tetrahydromethanopterin reductase-like flavin-dependent oxidoreductase (luciferase family)
VGTFRERAERPGETLEILTRAFAAETVDFEGSHDTLDLLAAKVIGEL